MVKSTYQIGRVFLLGWFSKCQNAFKNIKPMIFGKQPHYIDANALNLISELTDFINQSAWKEEYEYHFNFIKHKGSLNILDLGQQTCFYY